MEYTPTECRAIEQAQAEALNSLMANLNAFHECRKQLEQIQETIEVTHEESNANRAYDFVREAIKNIDAALVIVVGIGMRRINGQQM